MNSLDPIGELLPKGSASNRELLPTPDEAPLSRQDQLVLKLIEIGVSNRKAENMVHHFPPERIQRQLDWLPHRSARRPASMIIAAIENDYDEPAYVE